MLIEEIFTYLYIVPLLIGIIFAIIELIDSIPRAAKFAKYEENAKYNAMSKPFNNRYSNKLHEWSFKPPFSSFVPENTNKKEAIQANQLIAKAGYSELMDYRVLATSQIVLLILGALVTMIVAAIVSVGGEVFSVLFNLSGDQSSINQQLTIATFVLMLLMGIVPKMVLSSKAKNNHFGFVKDLPMLQTLLVLMVKSNRSMSEIMYTLSTSEIRYKSIFATAYRIYLRDKSSSFDYLSGVFAGTGFSDSITYLATLEQYSRSTTAEALQSKIAGLLADSEVLKKDKSVVKGLFAEGAVAIPFIAIILLGVVPIIIYAINMMSTAQAGAM